MIEYWGSSSEVERRKDWQAKEVVPLKRVTLGNNVLLGALGRGSRRSLVRVQPAPAFSISEVEGGK